MMSLDNCVERVLRSDLTRCRPVELLVFAGIAKGCAANAGDVFAVITMPVIRASAVGAAPNNVKAATAMALVERK